MELRSEYGEMIDYSAKNTFTVNGRKYIDLRKGKSIIIGKDEGYNYDGKNSNHYEGLINRKHYASEINVYEYENSEKFK